MTLLTIGGTTGMLLSIVRDVALDDGEMCRVSNARECRG